MENKEDSLLEDLGSLYSGKSNQLVLGGSNKPTKKKKRQRQRKYDENGVGELLINGVPFDQAMKQVDKEQERDLAQIAEILESRDVDDFSAGLIRANKSKYGKRGKEENPYRDEFKDELAIYYDHVESLKDLEKTMMRMLDGMTRGGKVRGATKGLTDLMNSILQCKTSQLQAVNQITNVKKDIVNFELKDSKQNSEDAASNLDNLTSTFMNNLFSGQGRNMFLSNATKNPIMGGLGDNEPQYGENEISSYLDDTVEELGDDARSSEINAYIKYETLEPEICIRKHLDGDWEFFARAGTTGETIPDYPVPGKGDVGEITFNTDGTTATDSYGGVYSVITTGYDDVYVNEENDYDPDADEFPE